MATKTKYSSKTPLTDEEQALQNRRGKYYRKLTKEACQSFLKGVDKDKVGIMLSGGVDSTITLWTLLELGIKPYVYTLHMPTADGISTDATKAKALAERYDLPFRLCEMTRDPDELAKMVKKLDDDHPDIETRPDFEVAPVFYQILKKAQEEDGVYDMFSGIADGGIHIVGRKDEIRGRYGRIGVAEANARRIFSVGGTQDLILTSLANNLGSRLLLPLQLVAQCMPYYNVPWHVTNIPRIKEITLNAFAAEEKSSGVKVQVAPLQNGDSGGRKYYDSMISSSQFAESFTGKRVSSAVVFYNALRGRYRKREKNHTAWWDWYGYVTSGIELPEGYKTPVDLRTGKAVLPDNYHVEGTENEGLFGDITSEVNEEGDEYKLNDKGELDRRVDCLGNPFYEGDGVALTACPRAQAGLCSKYYPDAEYKITQCEIWDAWGEDSTDALRNLAEVSAGQARDAYLEWAKRADSIREAIKNDRHTFS